jgi:SAM-dependent methyltransferase
LMKRRPSLSPATLVFLASFLGLFLELALIRWVSSEVRIFAYCKNLVLVASFLGFGAGCFLSKRRAHMAPAMFVLMLVTLLVRLPWAPLAAYGPRRVSAILSQLSGFTIFHFESGLPWGDLGALAFAVGWTSLLFFTVAFIMVPFGQITAAGISRVGNPIHAYSWNVAGRLAGILSYTLLTTIATPPLTWFVPVSLAATILCHRPRETQALIGVSLAMTLILMPGANPQVEVTWSSYQKLALYQSSGSAQGIWNIQVNNTGYQRMFPQPSMPPEGPVQVNRFTMPYALGRSAGRVLIVGAGSGNDAAMALRAGATEVTAVEIDRKIYEMGYAHHPQAPYSDSRVRVVIDDARHFLQTTTQRFDTIVYSHLDAHTLLSSYTNVRLDDYIHTTEAFQEARSHLAPDGLLYVAFLAQKPFVGWRLRSNLEAAFGHRPLFLLETNNREVGERRNVHFLATEEATQASFAEVAKTWQGFRLDESTQDITLSTDNWPFLALEQRRIPPFITLISCVILLLSAVFTFRTRPPGEPFDGRVFWLGAAFMLIETHNVSRLALVFGTTWVVNAWVIGVILGLILLANATYLALKKRQKTPGRWAIGGLFASLAIAYVLPPAAFLGYGIAGKFGITVLLSAPIFFAGLVFAEAFAASTAPGFALGWNVLGAVAGGMAESLSYVLGIPGLVPLAAFFYLIALLWPRPHPATG